MAGGLTLAGIFLVVLLNRRWPEFLHPVRNFFGLIANWVGDWAFIVEVWLFIGPGALFYYLEKRLAARHSREGGNPTPKQRD